MSIVPENMSRKIDNAGRVVVPRALRDKLFVQANDELWFSSLEYEGAYYVCLSSNKSVDPKYYNAAKVLKELGATLPPELVEELNREASSASQQTEIATS